MGELISIETGHRARARRWLRCHQPVPFAALAQAHGIELVAALICAGEVCIDLREHLVSLQEERTG